MEKRAHVYAYGDILPYQLSDGKEFGIVSVSSIKAQVDQSVDPDIIVVHIHSPGGDVNEGFAIYDYLRSLGKKIETRIEGLCASIATVVSLSGDSRLMTENSEFLIHNPWKDPFSMRSFTAEDYQREADRIKAAEDKLLNFYVDLTGSDRELLASLMKEETSLSADKALELKFITEVVETTSAKGSIYALLKTSKPLKPKVMSKEKATRTISDLITSIRAGLNKALGIEASITVTTTDNQELVIETEGETPAEGDPVTIGGEPAPDGDYTSSDGTVYTVAGGSISKVVAPQGSAGNSGSTGSNPTVESLQADLQARDNELAAVKADLETATTALEALSDQVNALSRQIKTPAPGVTPRSTQGKSVGGKGGQVDPKREAIEKRRAEREARVKA